MTRHPPFQSCTAAGRRDSLGGLSAGQLPYKYAEHSHHQGSDLAEPRSFSAALVLEAAALAQPIRADGMTCKILSSTRVLWRVIRATFWLSKSGSAAGQSARFDGGRQAWAEVDDSIEGSGTMHGPAKYKEGQQTAKRVPLNDRETTLRWPHHSVAWQAEAG
jgi:hypothetical protein